MANASVRRASIPALAPPAIGRRCEGRRACAAAAAAMVGIPARLRLLQDLAACAPGDKVRFLGWCVLGPALRNPIPPR